jgi:hypothetical protein
MRNSGEPELRAIDVLQTRRLSGGFVYIVTNKPNGILYIGVISTRMTKLRCIRLSFLTS